MRSIILTISFIFCALVAFGQRHDSVGNKSDITPYRGGISAVKYFQLPGSYSPLSFDSCRVVWVTGGSIYYHDCIGQVKILSMKDSNLIKAWATSGSDNQTLSLSHDTLTIIRGNSVYLPYLHTGDTAAMLAGYTRLIVFLDSMSTLRTTLAGKVSYTDTAAMLSGYARMLTLLDTAAAHMALIQVRVKYSDTAAMLSGYARSLALIDTAAAHLALINNRVKYSDSNSVYGTKYGIDSAVKNTRSWALATFLTSFTEADPLSFHKSDSNMHGNPVTLDYANSHYGTGSGSVTSVATSTGIIGGTITTSGTLQIDSAIVPKWDDTLSGNRWLVTPYYLASFGYKTGTVTSVATSTGIIGGTITSTGTLQIDSSVVPKWDDTLSGNRWLVTPNYLSSLHYGTGSVTSITAGAGLSGGTITTTGTISMPNVGSAGTYTYPSSVTTDAQGRVTAITAGSAPVTYTFASPLSLTSGTVSIPAATGSVDGYLTHTDWTTFNGKQAAGNYITDLTGDVTATGPGSVSATIANGAVTNAKVSNSAAIAYSKLNLAGQIQATVDLNATGTPSATTFLRGDNTWATPAGGGGSYTFSTGLTNTSGTVTNNLSTGVNGGQTLIGGISGNDQLNINATSGTNKGNSTSPEMLLTGSIMNGNNTIQTFVQIQPTVNQSGASSYTALKIKVTETALASGGDMIGCYNGASGSTLAFNIDRSGIIQTAGLGANITPQLGSDAKGDIYYNNVSGILTRLPIGSTGYILTVSGGIPSWTASTVLTTATTTINGNSSTVGFNVTIPAGKTLVSAMYTRYPTLSVSSGGYNVSPLFATQSGTTITFVVTYDGSASGLPLRVGDQVQVLYSYQ